MATQTRKRRPVRGSKTATTTQAPAATKTNNRADESTVAARRDAVQKRMINGGESAAAVAKDLGITAGKAAFIKMQLQVANGDVPKITGKNEETLLSNVAKARDKADEYSSWGWLSARSGIAEAQLKVKMTNAGHDVAGTQIASVRKANKPVTKKATPTAKKTAAADKSKTTRRARRSQADPS